MKPARFDYLRPDTPDEAIAALARHGADARVMAGGQSLMVLLNMRLARPKLLIDIARLEPLSHCRVHDDALVVGAGVTQAALLARPTLAQEVPLLAAVLPWVGHYQTRNRGTVCGSIAHADPSAELPLCLVALRGEVVLRARRGRRTLPADQFLLGVLATARRDDELVEAARFPMQPRGTGIAFREVAQRHGDFALVACAAVATASGLRLAVGGVAAQPTARDWPMLDGSALDDALNDFAWDLGATDDQHATASFRRDYVRRIGRAVIRQAMTCRH